MKAVIAILAISAAVVMAVDVRSPYRKGVISTVWIEAGDGTGTGVFVDDYLILTAAHVVEGKAYIVAHSPILESGVVVSSPDRYENGRVCEIIAIDMPKDLALLRVKRRGIPIKLAATEPSPGDPLFSIGCGDGSALFGYSTGHVRQIYEAEFPRACGDYKARSIDMSCPVNFGDSGGPVMANGELVGIITGMDAMKNQTYLAVTVREIRAFMERAKKMIRSDIACDPEIHRAACDIARRFAAMMSGILRDEERGECEREGYLIAREVIEGMVAKTVKQGKMPKGWRCDG